LSYLFVAINGYLGWLTPVEVGVELARYAHKCRLRVKNYHESCDIQQPQNHASTGSREHRLIVSLSKKRKVRNYRGLWGV